MDEDCVVDDDEGSEESWRDEKHSLSPRQVTERKRNIGW